MAKKTEASVKRDKVRIPVPQKPPKTEESKKVYNRRKINKETRNLLSERAEKYQSPDSSFHIPYSLN